MSLWLLLFDPNTQQGSAVPLAFQERGGFRYGPPQRECDAGLVPDKEDDLSRSAEIGVETAYDLLWREGYVRETLTVRFLRDNLPTGVIGGSGGLLFAVATLVKAMPRPQGYPPLAATGALDDKGRVQAVEGVPQKLLAALQTLPVGGMLFYPRANEAEIDADLIAAAQAKHAQLLPVERLDEAAQHLGIAIRKSYLDAPYLGLFPFKYEHRKNYFGRQKDVTKLCLRLLNREATGSSGLLIIAASGAGKSSLVRAGLIPALEAGPHALKKRPIVWAAWRPSECTDKNEAALAQSIFAAWQKQPNAKAIFTKLAAPDTLTDLAGQLTTAFPAELRFLWLIDQFEEFFTAGFDNNTLKRLAEFLESLQAAGVWIVTTLRNDFYPQYQQSLFLPLFDDDGQFNLPPLNASALDQIIKGPAELADYGWEKDSSGVSLADRLLKDIGDRTDALPLLEFVLYRLYHVAYESGQKQMAYASYDDLGGLFGAIGRHAETTFKQKSLDNSARDSLYRLLWKLTAARVAGDQQIAARPLSLADFPEGSPGRRLIDAFTEKRLLVQDWQVNGDIQVRVAHDALLQYWPTAERIIEGFLPDKQLHERLKGQAQDWKAATADQAAGFLLPAGPLLANAEGLLERMREMHELLDAQIIEWIQASVRANQELKAAELARQAAEQAAALQEQQQRTRNARRLALVMSLLAGGAGWAGYLAWQGKQEAELNFAEARKTVDTFVYDIGRKELADIPGLQELMKKFADRAVAQYAELIKRNPNDPDTHIGYAKAKGTLGSILADIGEIQRAENEIKEAIQLLEYDTKSSPNDWRYKFELAKQRQEMGKLYWGNKQQEKALPFAQLATQELKSLLLEHKTDTEVVFQLANAYTLLGNLKMETNDATAKKDFEASSDLALQILETYIEKADTLNLIFRAKDGLSIIYKNEKNFQKSQELLDEAHHYESTAIELKPDSPSLQKNYVTSLSDKGALLVSIDKPDEARKTYKLAVETNRGLVTTNPSVIRYSWMLTKNLEQYASLSSSIGDYSEARRAYSESISILDDIVQRTDSLPEYSFALVNDLWRLASLDEPANKDNPQEIQIWQESLEKALQKATQKSLEYPENTNINMILMKICIQYSNFDEKYGGEKGKQNVLAHYLQALKVYHDHLHNNIQGQEVVDILQIAKQAIAVAANTNEIEKAKQIVDMVGDVEHSHKTNLDIQLLGEIYNQYGLFLKRYQRYDEAITAFLYESYISETAWHKAPWHWHLHYNIDSALLNLIEIYRKIDSTKGYDFKRHSNTKIKPIVLEIMVSQEWLKICGTPMHSIDSSVYLSINPESATEWEIQKLREVTSKQYKTYMVTIAYIINGRKLLAKIPVTEVMWPKEPIEDQIHTFEEDTGGKVIGKFQDIYHKLQKAAHDNNVSFIDLLQYVEDGVLKEGGNNIHAIAHEVTKDDYEIVFLKRKNKSGDTIYYYVDVQLLNLGKLNTAITSGIDFSPEDFGTIVASGKGEPPEELDATLNKDSSSPKQLFPMSSK